MNEVSAREEKMKERKQVNLAAQAVLAVGQRTQEALVHREKLSIKKKKKRVRQLDNKDSKNPN